jgi:hypothetical protein
VRHGAGDALLAAGRRLVDVDQQRGLAITVTHAQQHVSMMRGGSCACACACCVQGDCGRVRDETPVFHGARSELSDGNHV